MRSRLSTVGRFSVAIAVLLWRQRRSGATRVRQTFVRGSSAVCHGADGAGGERGPNIVDASRGRSRSKEDFRKVITMGVPEARHAGISIERRRDAEPALFLGSLSSPAIENPRCPAIFGRLCFFFGEGKCSSCHTIRAEAAFLGRICQYRTGTPACADRAGAA